MSDEAAWPWSVLGLQKMPADVAEVRRAYARALKQIDQAKDIAGFEALRAAYAAATAQRSGATVRNIARQERTAQKRMVDQPVVAEAPPVSEEQALLALRLADTQHLLDVLHKGNLVEPAGVRIANVLRDPVMQDPHCRDMIRRSMAQYIRSQIKTRDYANDLPADITRETMALLDTHFGWLSDHAAYRRDFWNDTVSLDMMAQRRFGSIKPRPPAPVPKTFWGRVKAWIDGHNTILTVFWVGCFVMLRVLPDGLQEHPLWYLMGAVVVLPLVMYCFSVSVWALHQIMPRWLAIVLVIWVALMLVAYAVIEPTERSNQTTGFALDPLLAQVTYVVVAVVVGAAVMKLIDFLRPGIWRRHRRW